MGSGTLLKTIVYEHSSSLHSQMQVKTCKKKKTIYQQDPNAAAFSQAHFGWTEVKWKSVLWSDKSNFEILFGNHECCVFWAKAERNHPACHQHTVQKPAFMMVWSWITAHGMGDLHICEGTINSEYVQVWEQHMLPSRWQRLYLVQKTMLNYILHFYNSMALY